MRPAAEKGVAARLAARDGGRFVTHVLPLTSGTRRQAGASYPAVAAVFVQRAGQDASPATRMLAEQYALTPGAARPRRDHGFRRLADVAATLKLSPATVRTHLGRVFEKTGVRCHADLVKLAASYPAPILTPHMNGTATL